jgi:cobalt-zinc-cadmium efflux system outer membrane protein
MRHLFRYARASCALCLIIPLTVVKPAAGQRPATTSARSTAKWIDEKNGVSSDELIQRALRQNRQILASRLQIAEARGELRQAGIRPNPSLETSFASGEPLGSAGESDFVVGYSHIFELGGKRDRRVSSASLGVAASEQTVSELERALRTNIKARYVSALAAAENLATAQELLRITTETLRITQARVEQRESPALDARLLRVEASRLQSDSLIFEGALVRSLGELKTLVGIEPGEELLLKPEAGLPVVLISRDEAVERALEKRPDVQLAKVEEKRGAAAYELERANAVPNLTTTIRYSNVRSRFSQLGLNGSRIADQDNIIGVGISIPLPFRDRNQGNIEAASARKSAATLRREYLERQVRQEVLSAFSHYETARQAKALFDSDVLSQSEENIRTLRASYDLGETRLADLLNEQRRLIDTRRAYAEVLKEFGLAVVELEQVVGELGR